MRPYLAAQCIAARAQAKQMLRLLHQHAADIVLVMRLNTQYASMVRPSLAVLGRLTRVQALRRKPEAIDGAANQDARAQHVAERSMLLWGGPRCRTAAGGLAQSGTGPDAGRTASGSRGPERYGKHLRKATYSQDAAFETRMSKQPWNRGSKGSGQTGLREVLRDKTKVE